MSLLTAIRPARKTSLRSALGLSIGSAPALPAVIVARAKQAVYALEANTGPRFSPTSFVTNDPATTSALPSGAAIQTYGSQRVLVITGDGLSFDKWQFEIPVCVMNGAGSGVGFYDCDFNAAGIVAGAARYRNFSLGYNMAAGTVLADGSSAAMNHCRVTYDGGPVNSTAVFGLVQVGAYIDSGNFTDSVMLTASATQFRRPQDSQVQVFGGFHADSCFFGGFGMHPTDTAIHSEAIWAAYGDIEVVGSLFDHGEAEFVQAPGTWTGFLYLNARYRQLNYQVHGNVFVNPGPESNYAVQAGIHATLPGTLGTIAVYDNVFETNDANATFGLTGIAGADFDLLYDNFDFVTGARITTPAEVTGAQPLSISGAAPSATVGVAYSFTPTVGGGSSPYSFALSGTLPPGLSFDTGTGAITGTPNTGGTQALGIVGTPPAATVGSAYTFTPSASGGTGPYSFSLSGTLPPGLSFNTATGAITGTPT